MQKRVIAVVGLTTFVAALLMLQLSTPDTVGPFGVLAFFVLVYSTFAAACYILLSALVGALRRMLPQGKWRLVVEDMSDTKVYYYASIIGLAPVILIGMQSIGAVRLPDILLLVLFEVLGCFYVSRRF